MKKTILVSLLFVGSLFSLQAQIYTPSGTIQGTSSTNNVGIGVTNPTAKLTVQSSSASSNGGFRLLGFTYPNDINYWDEAQFAMMYNGVFKNLIASNGVSYFNGGNVGIGTNTPLYKLDIDNAGYGSKQIRWRAPNGQYGYTYSDSGGIGITNGDPYSELIYLQTGNKSLNFYTNATQRAVIDASGNLGIGTITPDEKLTVKGKIHTQEVKVDMLGALVPDYVFANDYKLKSLLEIESYIKENNHLPEIPSAGEIEKNGLLLAEMNMSLLKKVEELTLYMIEMKKENQKMKEDILKLKQNK